MTNLLPLWLLSLITAAQKPKRQPIVDTERNFPCSCGSGKRFKHCCATVHHDGLRVPKTVQKSLLYLAQRGLIPQ